MRRLLLQPPLRRDDVLSLEEILAEGVEEEELDEDDVKAGDPPSPAPRLCKARMKGLQQAAYHSAEHGFLDVTLELREMGERHGNCALETFNHSFAFLVWSHGGGGAYFNQPGRKWGGRCLHICALEPVTQTLRR